MKREVIASELLKLARELVGGTRIKRSPSGDYILCKLFFEAVGDLPADIGRGVVYMLKEGRVVSGAKAEVKRGGLLVSYRAQVRFGPDHVHSVRDKVVQMVESRFRDKLRFSPGKSDCEIEFKDDWRDPDTDYKMLGIKAGDGRVAGYRSEFMVLRPLVLENEGSTRMSLSNLGRILDAGYEPKEGVFKWDKNRADWSLEVFFKAKDFDLVASHVFKGFSVGYVGEGSRGTMEAGRMMGLRFDEGKVFGGALPDKGSIRMSDLT